MPSNKKLLSKMRQIVQWILVVHVVSYKVLKSHIDYFIHIITLTFNS